jgi:hypothetical protein
VFDVCVCVVLPCCAAVVGDVVHAGCAKQVQGLHDAAAGCEWAWKPVYVVFFCRIAVVGDVCVFTLLHMPFRLSCHLSGT